MPRIDPTSLEHIFVPQSLRPAMSGISMDMMGFGDFEAAPMRKRESGFDTSISLTRGKLPDNILTRRERFEKAPIDKMLRDASFPPKRWVPRNFDSFGKLAQNLEMSRDFTKKKKVGIFQKVGSAIESYMKYAFGTG